MEVEIVDSEGFAPESIVMLRAGQMRRQARVDSKLPFQFPSLPVLANPFKVEVYQLLGTKSLALTPDAEKYSVKFLPGSVEGVGASHLELSISDLANQDVAAAKAAAKLGSMEDEVDCDDGPTKKAAATADARGYLQKHALVGYVQGMLSDVLKEQPEDPFIFMSDLARRQITPANPIADSLVEPAAPPFPAERPALPSESPEAAGKSLPPGAADAEPAAEKVPPAEASPLIAAVEIRLTGVDFQGLTDTTKRQLVEEYVAEIAILTSVPAESIFDLSGKKASVSLSEGKLDAAGASIQKNLMVESRVHLPLGSSFEAAKSKLDSDAARQQFLAWGEARGAKRASTFVWVSPQSKWFIESQDQWSLRSQPCTLTVYRNNESPARFRLDAWRHGTETIAVADCTVSRFEELLASFAGTEKERRDAAITQIFFEQLVSASSSPEHCEYSASASPESATAFCVASAATGAIVEQAVALEMENIDEGDEVKSVAPPPPPPPPEMAPELVAPAQEEPSGAKSAAPPPAQEEPSGAKSAASPPVLKKQKSALHGKFRANLMNGFRDGSLEKVVDKMEEDAATAEAGDAVGAASEAANVADGDSLGAASEAANVADGPLELENTKLKNENERLQKEIDRIKAMLGGHDDGHPQGAAPAPPPPRQEAKAVQPPPPRQHKAAPPSNSAPKTLVIHEDTELNFDEALDKTIGGLYEELQKKNSELRANYTTLSTENQGLRSEREQMRETLLRICYGLEGMVSDIRSAVASPGNTTAAQPPPRSGDTEAENKRLEGANCALFAANRKLRQDNEVLQSELSSRQVSRTVSRAVTKPLESPP